MHSNRREFIRQLGLASATLPFLSNLNSFAAPGFSARRKQRLVVVFSPNGTVPWDFWPDTTGREFELKPILQPFADFRDRMLVMKGISDKLKGDGDRHMRGMGCLLTGIELFPGNIQGGSDTPAGWASGISLDQELKKFLQADEATRTRFGSLEFGVMVPDRADTWTRMSYAGPNQPVAPIDNPHQMFRKLYGQAEHRAHLTSILDELRDDLKKVSAAVSTEDRHLLERHTEFVRSMEQQLQASNEPVVHAMPAPNPNLTEANDRIPEITSVQMDLLVNSFVNDFARVATFQITNSVGQPRMTWLGIDEGHHGLSHEPDSNKEAHEKLTRINTWYAEQVASLVRRLAETPEPDGSGSLLDNTVVLWGNELGQGNSHTLDNIPFVMIGNGLDFRMGRSLQFGNIPHNRLLMSIAHGFGHHVESFGNPALSADGVISELTHEA